MTTLKHQISCFKREQTHYRYRTESVMQIQETVCLLCTNGAEDIYHFILDCDKLTEVRNTIYSLQRPYEEDKNQTLKEFLFNEGQDEDDMERRKIQLFKLWKARKRALKELQENSNDAQSALSAPRPSSHTSPPSNPNPNLVSNPVTES